MPGTPTSEVPSVTLSFANNFWGKDDAGVGPLLDRMHFAKVTNDELKAFYAARAAIEEEYSKKLLQLSRKPLGSSETGTLRMSCDVIRAEVESMGKAHQSVAQQMHTELEEPLQAFAGGMKERRKIVQNGIEKLLKLKMQQTATVNKARDRYEQDCLKIKGFLAQAHMVMGHEERKNKARLEKTQINLSTTSAEYEAAVKVLEETTGRWNRDWKAACDKFQDLEEERIDYTKSSLWNFANIASTVCVSDDASCEKMRLSLEDCDVEKDITNFITESGTGQEIPDPPKFINFCRGDAETSSQVSDDENYSVAQFARTMNPSYRASSPPISVFESHHDPNNPLAKELGLQQDTQPIAVPQDQINVPSRPESQQQTPRPSTASRTVQPDPRLVQAQQQARQQYQQNPASYNDYPADGMTQFCRPTAPSDRNGVPSPMMRPQSRDDSHSDHSDLNSFSSVEPPSGSASPGKPMSQSFPEPSPIEESSFQKKRGFFNSPFGRRKSRPEIETPASVMPNSRNTWAPASRQATNENVSPTRPLGRNNRQPMVQDATRSASPEPVDPRANFQLNVGNNVFDVASPDKSKKQEQEKSPLDEVDPIAAALEELRGVTKQSTLRVSADKFAGLATPHPPATPSVGSKLPGGAPTPLTNVNVNAAKRGTPPPSYEQPPMSRLGAPKPAHTARQMQKTTEMYVNQKANVFNGNAGSRPATRGNSQQEVPRAVSPAPNRATSPRPSVFTGQQRASQGQVPASPTTYRPAQRQQQQSPAPAANYNRSVSPNPYAASSAGGRPRAQTATAPAQAYGTPVGRNSYSSTRGASPAMRAPSPQPPQPSYAQSRPGSRAAPSSRAVSPQPAFRNTDDRPPSSHSAAARSMAGSERGDGSVYGGSIRGRPQSSYYGGGGGGSGASIRAESRVRSKSLAEPKNYNRDGRIILNYSQIPEELAFSKGDILAVLRLQDDGWWEAEVVGKDGRPGLVPSNYLQPC
ncbi:formin-binding protein [Didymella pomorum]